MILTSAQHRERAEFYRKQEGARAARSAKLHEQMAAMVALKECRAAAGRSKVIRELLEQALAHMRKLS